MNVSFKVRKASELEIRPLLKQCTAEESVRAANIKSRESEEKLKTIRGNIEQVAALPAFGALFEGVDQRRAAPDAVMQ